MTVYDMYQMMLTQEARVYKTLEELYYPITGVQYEEWGSYITEHQCNIKGILTPVSAATRALVKRQCTLYKLTIQRNHPGNQARALSMVEWARRAAQLWFGHYCKTGTCCKTNRRCDAVHRFWLRRPNQWARRSRRFSHASELAGIMNIPSVDSDICQNLQSCF